MDGSHVTPFKQQFQNKEENLKNPPDSSVFVTYLVPLKLYGPSGVLWNNPRPNSTFFCRPVRFEYEKETDEKVKDEYCRVSREIENLAHTKIGNGTISHKLICTMLDGKAINSITDCESTLRCYICGATSKEMNDLSRIYEKPSQDKFYQFGLSTLHAQIRTMEFLLDISYKLGTKKWTQRDSTTAKKKKKKTLSKEEKEENAKKKAEMNRKYKEEINRKKEEVQSKFRSKCGILIDFVKQGHGSTNDGNCARKFFENPEVTAEITGLNVEVIRRFKVILQAISSGEEIDPRKYGVYARKTAKIYVKTYSWRKMSPTMHKILIHGADIIKRALLPIGKLSEEALEARHKELRKCRSERARQMDRVKNNQDVLHWLLTTSDLFISSMRFGSSTIKKRKVHDLEVAELFVTYPSHSAGADDSGFIEKGDDTAEGDEKEEEEEEENDEEEENSDDEEED